MEFVPFSYSFSKTENAIPRRRGEGVGILLLAHHLSANSKKLLLAQWRIT
jgi:hypothetical protein